MSKSLSAVGSRPKALWCRCSEVQHMRLRLVITDDSIFGIEAVLLNTANDEGSESCHVLTGVIPSFLPSCKT